MIVLSRRVNDAADIFSWVLQSKIAAIIVGATLQSSQNEMAFVFQPNFLPRDVMLLASLQLRDVHVANGTLCQQSSQPSERSRLEDRITLLCPSERRVGAFESRRNLPLLLIENHPRRRQVKKRQASHLVLVLLNCWHYAALGFKLMVQPVLCDYLLAVPSASPRKQFWHQLRI